MVKRNGRKIKVEKSGKETENTEYKNKRKYKLRIRK
jgi:hypothetical protein